MTIIMSCDHHGPEQGIPDNRSRRRMLEQLRAATELGDSLADLFKHGVVGYDAEGRRAIAHLDMVAAVPVFQAWLAWLQVAPSGDDWTPPYDPPAEISIPDDVKSPEEGTAP